MTDMAPVNDAGHESKHSGCGSLILACIDYRFQDKIREFADRRGLAKDFDLMCLPGAALSASREGAAVFWYGLELAVRLHGVRKVLLVDHLDCGSYKDVYGLEAMSNPQRELHAHAGALGRLEVDLNQRFPQVQVERLIMHTDGSVHPVRPKGEVVLTAPVFAPATARRAFPQQG